MFGRLFAHRRTTLEVRRKQAFSSSVFPRRGETKVSTIDWTRSYQDCTAEYSTVQYSTAKAERKVGIERLEIALLAKAHDHYG